MFVCVNECSERVSWVHVVSPLSRNAPCRFSQGHFVLGHFAPGSFRQNNMGRFAYIFLFQSQGVDKGFCILLFQSLSFDKGFVLVSVLLPVHVSTYG